MISKNNTEVLCRTAWQDATNDKEANIDDWVRTTFNNKFNKFKKYPSIFAYITKEDAELLCRTAWWNVRVNSDIYSTVQIWLNSEFLAKTNDIKKNIIKTFTAKPITYVYLVIYENDVSGAWTDPEEAVKNEFSYDLRETGGIRLSPIDRIITVKEAVEEMLKPNSHYPYLKKVKINPVKKVY